MTKREQKSPPVENNPQDNSADRLEMRLPASAEWVRVVRLATAGVANRVGFFYDEVEDIKLAVAEACNNAIIHSATALAPGASTPQLRVQWQILEDGVKISVSDEGRLSAPNLIGGKRSTPHADELAAGDFADLPEGGMGLLLIESLMDEIEHESGPDLDTTIHMTKYLAAQVAPEEQSTPSRPHPDSPVSLRPARQKSIASDPTQPAR